MVTVFHNYNQRNFAMANIVPDLSNPSEILQGERIRMLAL